MSASDGSPPSARIIAGTVVTSSSSMTRGFVSSTYARILELTRWAMHDGVRSRVSSVGTVLGGESSRTPSRGSGTMPDGR